MARRRHENPAAETLEEIQEFGDRLAERIANRPLPVIAGVGTILAAAAIWGFAGQYREGREERASAALEAVRSEYVTAMGGRPGALEVSEPANPETGRQVRSEYVQRFTEVAEEHGGRGAGALAWIEVGDLRAELGEDQAAAEAWERAADSVGSDSPTRALALLRLADSHEQAGRWREAGSAHERAGSVEGYPLRYLALADAARCFAAAGDSARAIQLYKQIQGEAPDAQIPEHIGARLRELEAAAMAEDAAAP